MNPEHFARLWPEMVRRNLVTQVDGQPVLPNQIPLRSGNAGHPKNHPAQSRADEHKDHAYIVAITNQHTL